MTARLRDLLVAERLGVLATLSTRRAGWPFASLVPYALTPDGEPILLLSELAEHTHNVHADSRASLLVADSSAQDDPQAGARVTLLGTVEPTESEQLRRCYVSRQPTARELLALADFRLYVLRVAEARFIAGFGEMGWLSGAALRAALSPAQNRIS